MHGDVEAASLPQDRNKTLMNREQFNGTETYNTAAGRDQKMGSNVQYNNKIIIISCFCINIMDKNYAKLV